MREIKFRVWDKVQQKYIYDPVELELLFLELNITVSKPVIGFAPEYCERFVFEEYTGLKDRNGVEIYEGDVVSVPYVTPDGKITDTVDYTASVVFKSGSFCITGHEQGTFVLLSNWCIPTGVNYVSNYGEVIQISNNTYLTTTGNIHTKTDSNVQP